MAQKEITSVICPKCGQTEKLQSVRYTIFNAKFGLTNEFSVLAENARDVAPCAYCLEESTWSEWRAANGFSNTPQSSGACFIATATYNDYNHPNVLIFRRFRDDVLISNSLGKMLVSLYYRVGPILSIPVTKFALIKKMSKRILDFVAKIWNNYKR